MTTPQMAPAGWYADPASRHENRYWDGTGWTAAVADRGVTATDPLESPPPLPAEASPATAPATSTTAAPATAAPATAALTTAALPGTVPTTAALATARRGRPKRAFLVAVIAVAAVLGLIIGLLLWAPWQSPPLLRPTGPAAGT